MKVAWGYHWSTSHQADQGLTATAEDRLPSAVSIVQHLSQVPSVRLCAVDVERSASGERTQIRSVHGHGAGARVDVLMPHPQLPLLASIDHSGELMLWEYPLARRMDRYDSPPRTDRDAQSTVDVEVGAPRWMLQLPGSYNAAVWPTHSAQLVVVNKSGIELFACANRAIGIPHQTTYTDAGWQRSSRLPFASDNPESALHGQTGAPPFMVFTSCAIASVRGEAPPDTASGFTVRAGCIVAVWAIDGTTLRWLGEASLLLPSGAGVASATSLPLPVSHNPSQPVFLPGGGYGAFAAAYCDGGVCTWSATHGSAGLELTPGRLLSLRLPPNVAQIAVSGMCASGQGVSVRVALVSTCSSWDGTVGEGSPGLSSAQFRVLEFDSHAPEPKEEFELPLEDVTEGVLCSCAFTMLAGGVLLVAVCTGRDIRLLTRSSSTLLLDRASWYQLHCLHVPDVGGCSAVSWLGSSLVTAVGAHLAAWPALLLVLERGCARHGPPLPQWHPALLMQLFLSGNKTEKVLQHLQEQPALETALAMPLKQLIVIPEPANADTLPASRGTLEDMFAPAGPSDTSDFFAPSNTSDFFAPSTQAELPALQETFAGSLGSSVSVSGATVDRLAGALQQRMASGEVQTRALGESEQRELLEFLATLKMVATASAALDVCGMRFLMHALAHESRGSPRNVNSLAVAWAMQSDCQQTLIDMCLSSVKVLPDWVTLRSFGVGFWMPQARRSHAGAPQPSMPHLVCSPHGYPLEETPYFR